MKVKRIIQILLFSGIFIFLLAAKPAVTKMPPDLASVIEKKWPGSKADIYGQLPVAENNTMLYKISQSNETIGWAYTRRVFSCRAGGCDQHPDPAASISREYFDYYAILDKQYSILEIKVFNYAATHGQEICSKAWLRQFKGYNGLKPLRYGKDIDGISGATISGRAITEDVETGIKILSKK
jgi:hypothetical protein